THKDVVYGFVGRISQFKNLDYLLTEFKLYFEKYPLDKLFIYGEGPELQSMNSFIKQNNLLNNINILGFEPDKEKIYSTIDVLIDPSYGQGISNANLEAMSTKTLVIASKVDGNIDLIEDGKTGLLFELRKKDALLNKLIYYKSSPNEAKLMIDNARKMILEKYDIKSIPPKIINFILCRN
ncbi:MAG: glycosyltransferase, partial [Candidatus Hermodarchaeota archaeon]